MDGTARPGRSPRSRACGLLGILTLVSCGGGGNSATVVGPAPVSDAPKVLTAVQVALPATPILVGERMVVSARGLDQTGAPMPIAALIWTTASPAVATANDSGVVLGVAPGTTTVVASVGAVQGSAALTVILVPVTRVTITPAFVPLGLGGTQQLAADARDDRGNVLPGRPVAWASSTPSVATVSATGLVTAIAVGTANVTATIGGVTATALVTVTTLFQPVAHVALTPTVASVAVGQTLQIGAVLSDAAGEILSGHGITWTSSAPAVATVSPTGLVTPVAAGTAQVTATSEGQSAAVTVTVTQDLTVKLVSPDVTTDAGDSVQVIAFVVNLHPLASVTALVGVRRVTLVLTRMGALGLTVAWTAEVDLREESPGVINVVVTATDVFGAEGTASLAFRHDPTYSGGSSSGDKKSKALVPAVPKRVP